MSDKSEIQNAIETIDKVQMLNNYANDSCNELISVVKNIIERINSNTKIIESLVQEVKNNEAIIEEHKKKSEINYDIDDFVNK